MKEWPGAATTPIPNYRFLPKGCDESQRKPGGLVGRAHT